MNILDSRITGKGKILDVSSVGTKNNRTPNGDYLMKISLEVEFAGHVPQNSTKIHQIPKNRTIYILDGKMFPIKGDPQDPNTVEIDWDHFVPIDGKKALDSIVKELSPILKAAGYRKPSSRTFNCVKEDGLVHVINFQASKWGDEFTINVGVYLRELRRSSRQVDEKHVHEEECEFGLRWRIDPLIPRNKDTWWDYEEPEKAIKEVSTYLLDFVFPHLKKFESRELMKNSVEYFVLDILKSKKANFKEIFTEDFFSQLQKNYPPEYRTALFNSFPSNWWHEVVLESEKGIDGGLYEGSVKIRNAEVRWFPSFGQYLG